MQNNYAVAYDYVVILNPHQALREKILFIKNDFYNHYKAPSASWSKTYLTLVKFTQLQVVENRIIHQLNILAKGCPPLKIELKKFASFPSHTIYINVISKVPIQNLIKQIRSQAQGLLKLNDENKPHFIMEPNFTIAQKLLPWQYEQAWQEYRYKDFTARFVANEMILLKRPTGELKYTIVQTFEFENLPIHTVQGELF